MRAYGTGIFENQLALEVRTAFVASMREGSSVFVAAEKLLEFHAASLHDPTRAPAILFALAALQLEHGVISAPLRKRVLTWINSGESLDSWSAASPEILAVRKVIEQELRAKLVAMG